jgi:hypothetical protein
MGDPNAIDPAWLTGALADAGVGNGANVTEISFGGYIGTGQTGRNARLHLTWDRPGGAPASLVAKFASDDETARASAFANGTYLKECTFYDQVAATVGVRAPRCHVAGYNADVPAFLLLLEDLADSEQGDQLDGLTPDRVSLGIEQAAALHAPRFGDPTLASLFAAGEPELTPEEMELRLQTIYGFTLPGFLERLGNRLDPDVVELVNRFGEKVGRWTYGTGTPRTLVHFDFRADNLLFAKSADAPPIVVVDWQTVNAGIGHCDVAYLISGSYPDATQRAAAERDFLEEYRGRMAAAGIEQSFDECWRDYRYGSLWGIVITVIATVLAANTERGNDMLTAMAQRHGRQAIDLDALALLD